MAIGKYLSLEEARNSGKLERFAKAHPSKGNAQLFDNLLGAMSKTPESDDQTSNQKHHDED